MGAAICLCFVLPGEVARGLDRNNSPRERTSPKDKNCTSLFFSYSNVSGTSSTSPHINSLLIFILLIGALLKDLEMKRLCPAVVRLSPQFGVCLQALSIVCLVSFRG